MTGSSQRILALALIPRFGGNAQTVTNGQHKFITEPTALVVPFAIMRDAQRLSGRRPPPTLTYLLKILRYALNGTTNKTNTHQLTICRKVEQEFTGSVQWVWIIDGQQE